MLVDARERNAELGAIVKIPGADYSYILRNPKARIENRINRANCHRVVVGEYPVRRWSQGKELLRQFRSAFGAVNIDHPSREYVAREGFCLVFCQCLEIPVETPYASASLRPAKMSNPLTADFDQMLRRKCPDHFVIGANITCVEIVKPAVNQDQGWTLVLDAPEHLRGRAR